MKRKLLLYTIPLALSIMVTGCKDKKIEAEDVETAAVAVEETSEEVVIESTEETERAEKNTIAVVGNVNLRSGFKNETSAEETLEEVENEKVDLRSGNLKDTKEDNEETSEETSEKDEETSEEMEKIEIGKKGNEESEEDEKREISGNQYQNFIANMDELKDYKYVGYDGDSTVFLNIDDNRETISMLAVIYRDSSYIKNKFNGMEDLGDEQKKQIGADLIKELTGININIAQTDFRERECESGKYLGLPFGDSSANSSGYLAFRIKKDKLECVICTIDSTEPEDRKQMKDDVLKVLEGIQFNGEECNSDYDIAFDNINLGIEKMKNGE